MPEDKAPVNKFFHSKIFRQAIIIIIALFLLLLAFQTGMFIGFRKANFAFRWADSYQRNFGEPRGGFLNDFSGRDFVNGHGVSGEIVKINSADIIIKGSDETEKIVMVDASTTINSGRDIVATDTLKIDDHVVVIGTPNDSGTIVAKLIRVFSDSGKVQGMTPVKSGSFCRHHFLFW